MIEFLIKKSRKVFTDERFKDSQQFLLQTGVKTTFIFSLIGIMVVLTSHIIFIRTKNEEIVNFSRKILNLGYIMAKLLLQISPIMIQEIDIETYLKVK